MPRINKGDFILANIPVDLPEAIPFLQYSSKLLIIHIIAGSLVKNLVGHNGFITLF